MKNTLAAFNLNGLKYVYSSVDCQKQLEISVFKKVDGGMAVLTKYFKSNIAE